jgi:hypothetical protein
VKAESLGLVCNELQQAVAQSVLKQRMTGALLSLRLLPRPRTQMISTSILRRLAELGSDSWKQVKDVMLKRYSKL